MPSIFLSHSWEDKFFVKRLAEKLCEAGVDIWIDEAELKIGDSLIQKISKAIEKTDYVAAVISHNSVLSPWVQKELAIAMTQEIAGKKVKVLPILLERCKVPGFLRDKLYADFTNPKNFDTQFSRLLHAVGVSKTTTSVSKKVKEVIIKKSVKPMSTLEVFEDVNIIGIDKNRLYRPDPEKLLYYVYFILSSRPPGEWIQIFKEERRFPRHTMWRDACVDGQYIIVHCCLDEIKKYHLRDIKQDVENTNQKYREYLHKQEIEQEKERQREEKERKEIDEAVDGINFD